LASSGYAIDGARLARRLNVPFWVALAVVVAGYVIAFYVLRALVPQQEIAGTLAALVLGGGAYVQLAVERRLRAPNGTAVKLSGHLRPWWMLALLVSAAIALALVLEQWIRFAGGPITVVSANVDVLIRLLAPAAALLGGAVIGQRADRFGLVAAVLATLVGYFLAQALIPLFLQVATGMPPAPDFVTPPGGPPDPRPLLLGEGFVRFLLENPLPLLMAASMLGFWYGTRTRLQSYVGGLLRMARPEDRGAIVELAYEAARQAAMAPALAEERVAEPAAGEPDHSQ
jgi:hypothetical protein